MKPLASVSTSLIRTLWTVKAELCAWPVARSTSTGPVVAPLGTVAVIWVPESTVKAAADAPVELHIGRPGETGPLDDDMRSRDPAGRRQSADAEERERLRRRDRRGD